MTTTSASVSVREVSDLAMSLTSDNLGAAVAALDDDVIHVYLAKILDQETNLSALKKGLTQRLMADGKVGAHFEVDGRPYGFFGSLQKGYKDFPGLVRFLIEDCGISPLDIAVAVSDARVTDLRSAASRVKDEAKREAALQEIEDHRVEKGERGAPRFQEITEFMKGAKP